VSRQNVELVEGLVAGVAGLDMQALLAALPELIAQTCTPDIEWIEDPERADSHTYHGHDAVQRSWKRWLEQWDEYGFEAEQFIDCGEDVLVVSREHGRGVASGASVSSLHYAVLTIRAGKIARFREFYNEHAALKAVGLEE
jgi:ketosteroid isomerase-like protein